MRLAPLSRLLFRARPRRRSVWRPLAAIQRLESRTLLATFVVSPDGDDSNPGTVARPLETIQRGLDLATRPGDIVSVRNGVYEEPVTFMASGSSRGYITLQAFANEHPVIDGTNLDDDNQNLVTIENRSYVKVIGLELVNNFDVTDGSGIRVEGSGKNIELRNNRIHDIRGENAMGITVYGTKSTAISKLIIDGNEIYDCDAGPSEALVVNGNISDFQITNNRVHDINNIGIDIIGGERDIQSNSSLVPRTGVVSGNVVYRARSAFEDGFAAGIYVDGGKNITIENNLIYENDVGMEIGAENSGTTVTGVIVRNNVIVFNDKAGLAFGGYDADRGRVKNSSFLHNTIVGNDTLGSGFGQLWIQYASDNVVANNIFASPYDNVLIASDAGNLRNTLNDNLYFTATGVNDVVITWNGTEYNTLAEYQAATRQDSRARFGDPKFADADNFDFRLLSGSPAINVGTNQSGRTASKDFDGRRRPQGPKPDLGAFEFASTTAPSLSASQKRRTEQLISIFENDTPELQYDYIEALNDGRGFTAGRAGFTTATGDLVLVVERFVTQVPDSPLAAFLPRLQELSGAGDPSLSGLDGFDAAWQAAAANAVFRAAQDAIVDELYYQPMLAHAKNLGLRKALSLAILYDTIIQHGDGDDPDGLRAIIQRTNGRAGGTPVGGIQEKTWIGHFLQVRRETLLFAFDPDTREAWAESVSRVNGWKSLADANNWSLNGPIQFNTPPYTPYVLP